MVTSALPGGEMTAVRPSDGVLLITAHVTGPTARCPGGGIAVPRARSQWRSSLWSPSSTAQSTGHPTDQGLQDRRRDWAREKADRVSQHVRQLTRQRVAAALDPRLACLASGMP
jgi:hypothetical protein